MSNLLTNTQATKAIYSAINEAIDNQEWTDTDWDYIQAYFHLHIDQLHNIFITFGYYNDQEPPFVDSSYQYGSDEAYREVILDALENAGFKVETVKEARIYLASK